MKTSVRGAVAIVMLIPPAPETKAAYHKASPPDCKNNTKSIDGANRHTVVLSPDAIRTNLDLLDRHAVKIYVLLPMITA